VPLAKYGVPGTDELTQDILENYIKDYDAFLLANHGVVSIGPTLMNAYYKMETVEHFAQISLVARQLGSENVFSPERAQELMDARARYGVQAGGACRIEYKDKNKDVQYAPEVPRTGAGAAGYAADSSGGGNQVDAANVARGNGNGQMSINEAELPDVIREVTRRVVEKLQNRS
jgi:L-fuculose-phosphate aldolase